MTASLLQFSQAGLDRIREQWCRIDLRFVRTDQLAKVAIC